MKLKAGDTITDGFSTYVVRNNGNIHYVGSGSHADYQVSKGRLFVMLFTTDLEKHYDEQGKFAYLDSKDYEPLRMISCRYIREDE